MRIMNIICWPVLLCGMMFIPGSGCRSASAASGLQPVEGRNAILTGWGIGLDQLALAKEVGVRQVITWGGDPKDFLSVSFVCL